jgi:hypothetical protein
MKKIFAVVLIVATLCCLTACDVSSAKEKNTSAQLDDIGFEVIKHLGSYGDCDFYLVYDIQTKVEYIFATGYCRTSWCPYYDENGNVSIYEGE